MTATMVMAAISASGVVFLIYVFIALCKESRNGARPVGRALLNPEQREFETSLSPSRKVIRMDAHTTSQRRFSAPESQVAERRLSVGR